MAKKPDWDLAALWQACSRPSAHVRDIVELAGRQNYIEVMAKKKKYPFLSTVDGGRTVASYRKNQQIFSQGERADPVFYIQEGKVKVYVISEQGKEAVVALHGNGDFLGEGCLTGQPLRLATAVAMTHCVIMRLDKVAIVRVLHDEPKFSEMFMSYILARNARVEEDLVDAASPALRGVLCGSIAIIVRWSYANEKEGCPSCRLPLHLAPSCRKAGKA
jgi:hypothetical protein